MRTEMNLRSLTTTRLRFSGNRVPYSIGGCFYLLSKLLVFVAKMSGLKAPVRLSQAMCG